MSNRKFSDLVSQGRAARGLSQSRLADLVGRSQSTVRAWERGQSSPADAGVLSSLAAVLGLPEDEMFAAAGMPLPDIETHPTIEQALLEIAPEEVKARHQASKATVSPSPAVEAPPSRPEETEDRMSGEVMEGNQPDTGTEIATSIGTGPGTGVTPDTSTVPAEPVALDKVRNTMLDSFAGRRTLREEIPTSVHSVADAGRSFVDQVGRQMRTLADRLAVMMADLRTRRPGRPGPEQPSPVVPASPSYMEDPELRKVYDLRRLYTALAMTLTLVVTLWAFRQAREAVAELADLLIPEF